MGKFSNDPRPRGKYENEEKTRQSLKNTVLMYLHDFVFWLSAILLVFMLLFRVVVVSGPSMNDTLVDGDYLLLMNSVLAGEPRQGDIVVIGKYAYKEGEPIIKRVIATEGQWVQIDFFSGVVYVDGNPLEEPYTKTDTNLFEGVEFPVQVKQGHVFVMGDNRNESKDSRSLEIGQINKQEILGKALLLVFPGPDVETFERNFKRIGVIS